MFKDKNLINYWRNRLLRKTLLSIASSIQTLVRYVFSVAMKKKQHDMRIRYNNDKLKFHIGDVRSYDSISMAMRGVDYLFSAAALKQVPSCEFYPVEAVRTNVLGTEKHT